MADLAQALAPFARRGLRWYGMHAPYRGKRRILNYLVPRLTPKRPLVVVVKAPHGFLMSLDLSERVQEQAYYWGYFEGHIAKAIAEHVTPGTVVINLGANFGQFSLLAAQILGDSGKVLAYEPAPATFASLQRNVKVNQFERIITCRQSAAGISAGTATFYVAPTFDSGTSSLARQAVEQYHNDVQRTSVNVERLDDLLEREPLAEKRVSLIKLDIQGAELPALQGAEALLRRDHPTLIVEVDDTVIGSFGYDRSHVGSFLHSLGYTFHSLQEPPFEPSRELDYTSLRAHDILCLYTGSAAPGRA